MQIFSGAADTQRPHGPLCTLCGASHLARLATTLVCIAQSVFPLRATVALPVARAAPPLGHPRPHAQAAISPAGAHAAVYSYSGDPYKKTVADGQWAPVRWGLGFSPSGTMGMGMMMMMRRRCETRQWVSRCATRSATAAAPRPPQYSNSGGSARPSLIHSRGVEVT